jgi:hypothetical protein
VKNQGGFMKLLLTIGLALALGLTSTFAGNDYKWMSSKDLQKAKKMAIKRGKRKIASEPAISDDAMSEKFRGFRDKFLTIIKKEEIEKFLHELDENYDSYPNDLKFFAAQMIPFLTVRSFTYKMYPLVSKVKVTHSVMLTRVLNFASFMRINLPTSQWEAGFRFASEPFTADEDRFEKTEELQAYVENTIYPAFMVAAKRIQNLDFTSEKIVWDHKLFYGVASFTDNFKRYRYIGEAERVATLASLHEGMAWMKRFAAYNVTGSMELAKDLGVLVGVDSFFSKVDGVTAQKVTGVLNKDEHKHLYTLLDGGKEKIQVAFSHLREAARLQVIAWNEVKDRPANELDAMNSIILDPFRDRIDRGSENLEKMVAGPTIVRSDVTGELVKVDLPAFYANPPKDLKTLLPNEFRGGDKMIKKKLATKSGKTKRVKFRNYFYGAAVGWNLASYKALFPELKDGRDVAKATRILNQSAGTFPVAMGMNAAMAY